MRLIIARCQVDYSGRLTAHLPFAKRLIMVKADGSVSIHADDRAYKPLNWMSAPCTLAEREPTEDERAAFDEELTAIWSVKNKGDDELRVTLGVVEFDNNFELGVEPGLVKDGVEAQLQVLLAENPGVFGAGWHLVRREYPTAIGPVDIMYRDENGANVAVEVKRRGEIDGVEQLTRYLELLNADPLLRPVRGIFAAQQIKPQAKVVAAERGIECKLVDYEALQGNDHAEERLF
ncbi:MAG: endonuclease NucS [Propionibacteriaceae bacterium]|nr:endonuclease NucS [Propionibacteriaceae bacterium]